MEESNGVNYHEEFILNSRNMKLFTCRWLPAHQEIKSLVFLCHGYGVECSIFMRGTGLRLAQAGHAVFGIDYEGHGKSDGQPCYIKNFDDVVNDAAAFFRSIRDQEEYRNKARFLFGESMGGAVALLIHRKEPEDWNGAILVAPMCKISENLKPPRIVVTVLTKLASLIPTWKIVPTKDILEVGFKDPLKREEIRSNPFHYQDKPRIRTALEMLHASTELEKRLDEVTLPFLILHGADDVVTDPAVSKALYESAESFDKTLKMYPGMWHALTSGEPDDNIEIVFRDILSWLSQRCPADDLTSSPMRQSDLSHVLKEFGSVDDDTDLKIGANLRNTSRDETMLVHNLTSGPRTMLVEVS
eukprot:c27982_g3_i1 orf=348-1421(-)